MVIDQLTIAFVTDRNGPPEIWLRSRERAWERPSVSADRFSDEPTHTFRLPTFSPHGQKIAFERVTDAGPPSGSQRLPEDRRESHQRRSRFVRD